MSSPVLFLYNFFGKMSLQIFCSLFESLVFLLLSYKSASCVLDTSP